MAISEKGLQQLQESLSAETKSSAGDKHETGRAMIQLEREQLGNQLANIEAEKEIILKIDPSSKSQIIGLGAVVLTSQHHYFIATSIGKIRLNNTDYYALSLGSPIGQLLSGKRAGDKFVFRNQEIEILEVL
ncbi:3-oxoacyl-ACP synthase [Weeksellaceae bacterium KMM 9713]|uniref:3-oxoacyl-ACP synthase n=1 Tax=Profundicola chukchiensis TaxID=2961959 RepID=A0A9X4RUZ1_9FLAO|nr:3-oxoacyl-ACP synthase [Profundicola chukchiensis]MDG4946633.1 3-oxoacyl-ACP synthase [Profundicola chukchiensis]